MTFFDQLIGQEKTIDYLKKSVDENRIAHAQLFVGKEGVGSLLMALGYAEYLLTKENIESKFKTSKLQHPDLHFCFPTANTDLVKKNATSKQFLAAWRTFVFEQPYGNLFDWYEHLEIANKQGMIGVDDAEEIVKSLSLKSYEGGYKIMIIWMAEKMNTAAANKLLKLIEEPPHKTLFLLVTTAKNQLINTILSRCQVIEIPPISEENLIAHLVSKQLANENVAKKIAHQSDGSYHKCLQLLKSENHQDEFEQLFVTWIRAAFKAKGNASVIQELVQWSDTIQTFGREKQKLFLHYCLQFFRQALLLNYQSKELVFYESKIPGFSLDKFAPFVHSQNIHAIYESLNEAIYHIERNGNAKIILLDTSIKLTRLLHTKEV